MKIAGLFAGAVLAATAAAAPASADIFIDFHDAPDSVFYTGFLDLFYQGEQMVPSIPAGPDLGVRFNDFVARTVSLNSTLITGAFIDPDIPPEGPPFIVIKGAFKHVSFDYGEIGVGAFDARVGSPVDGQPFAYSGLLTKPTAVDTLNTISFDVTGVGQELDLNFFFTTGTDHSLFITNLSLTSADSPTDSVPEPGTWALMIGGFGLAGGALRRRRGGPALGR